jgi:uncharacterized FlaG/YvyC family protein
MSAISIAPVSGAAATPAPQNPVSRASPARAEANPSVQTISNAAVAAPKPAAKPETDTASKLRENLRAIADGFGANTSLVIRVDSKTKSYIYEFRDGESGELIRQYPEADLAALLKSQRGTGTGVFVETRV